MILMHVFLFSYKYILRAEPERLSRGRGSREPRHGGVRGRVCVRLPRAGNLQQIQQT